MLAGEATMGSLPEEFMSEDEAVLEILPKEN